jgi:hypothetical protein
MTTYSVWKYYNDGWNYTVSTENGYGLSGNWTKVKGDFDTWEAASKFIATLE